MWKTVLLSGRHAILYGEKSSYLENLIIRLSSILTKTRGKITNVETFSGNPLFEPHLFYACEHVHKVAHLGRNIRIGSWKLNLKNLLTLIQLSNLDYIRSPIYEVK